MKRMFYAATVATTCLFLLLVCASLAFTFLPTTHEQTMFATSCAIFIAAGFIAATSTSRFRLLSSFFCAIFTFSLLYLFQVGVHRQLLERNALLHDALFFTLTIIGGVMALAVKRTT